MPAHVRVADLNSYTEEFQYRTPFKFGGVVLDRARILNVQLTVETPDGRIAHGFGSMPLGNVWAFPSRRLNYDETLGAMQAVADRVAGRYLDWSEFGHPIHLFHHLEPQFYADAQAVTVERQLVEPIPKLATLVVASPFDAALHDAYGKLHGVSSYHTYGRDFLPETLDHFLGREFAGLHLESFVNAEPVEKLPLYHLVGALDPLTAADIQQPCNDGWPETLGDWIRFNGLTHIKIKLNGDDLNWDVERVLAVERVADEVLRQQNVPTWRTSLDFNERCASVDYLLEFLRRLEASSPPAFERVHYIEQPTARDLKSQPDNTMHAAAKLKPVVIDESLIDLESLLLAREMGYTGAALKACKGQSSSLLMAAAAQKLGLFLCVQDLTCPGASFIHSAGLAAHVPGVQAIETNSRQYMPEANVPWAERFPGLFKVADGTVHTGSLTGAGLGAVD